MAASASPSWNDRLRQERIQRNWRQQDLADQLGATVVTIQRWERGSHQPGPYFRLKLCALFGKSAQDLGLVAMNAAPPSITKEEGPETVPEHPSPAEGPGLWTVPYLRNPHFTGRDDLLDQLAQQLSFTIPSGALMTRRVILSQPQAIKGLGGIGKTQIAVEYAYRAGEQGRYTHVLWVNAASSEAILTSFQTLVQRLPTFAARDEKDQHKLITAILRWLEECREPWLLIFDNADDLTLVQPYFPQQGCGSILLTTRASAVSWLADAIEVEQMGLMEGTQFLLHRTGRLSAPDEECNEATNIVIALDGFPLALDQAGAYIEETGCSFRDYLRLYEQHRAKLLARRGNQASNYPASVATTWDLSFQKIEQTQPASAELLRLCAFLAPDHIPEELLTEGAMHWPPLLQEAVTDPLRFNELLEALLAFSLVKRLSQERLLSLHRLVQAVQMDRMDLEVQRQWAERVVHAVNTLFPAHPKEEVESWPQCLRYLEQVQACDWLIQQYRLEMPEAVDLLERAGIYLRDHASYNLAESLFQRALTIAEQQLGSHHLDVATCLNNLAILCNLQGKYQEAEPFFLRALCIREEQLGSQHPDVASSLNNLAILYRLQGKYQQAESFYLRALHIKEQQLGPQHPTVATFLNNLGYLYIDQGKYQEADLLCSRALHIKEQQLGPQHPAVASSLNNLAILYKLQGKYQQAESVYLRALRIREEQLGPQHPDLGTTLINLASLYTLQSRYREAERLLQQALSSFEQQLGPDHTYVAHALMGLADLYRNQGNYDQALSLYQRSLHIWEQALGQQNHGVAYSLLGLADLCREQGHYAEAESFYQQVLDLRERAFGPDNPLVAFPLLGLAELYREQGQYQQADALYQRVLTIRQQQLSPQHPDLAETLHDLAQLREMQQQLTEAVSLYQQALTIREQSLGAQHSKTIDTRQHLYTVLQTLGKKEEAIALELSSVGQAKQENEQK